MALLECRGATRAPWFSGLDLDLEGGEIVVLSGPSGSGKTLFLRALADLDPLDSGTLTLGGRAAGDLAATEWRRRVVYLHQDPVRLPGTVHENLACVTHLEPRPPRAPEGIDPGADAQRLSGGEMQRVALERALAVEPEVLLLDEASSALDPDAARRFEARVQEWVAQGHAALWVSHDEELADRLGARRVAFP
jgi:putative ABC transport system ATP-binding protein